MSREDKSQENKHCSKYILSTRRCR